MSTIDYARMQRSGPRLKAQLTRAERSGDPAKIVAACRAAVVEWNAIVCWPDNWHRWNIAFSDVAGYAVRLDDLADPSFEVDL